MSEFEPGQVFHVPFPFVLRQYTDMDINGMPDPKEEWKPGTDWQLADEPGEGEFYAHGMGWMILTVVSTHKPGRFQERVFYTRQWVDPEGRTFGRTACQVSTVRTFRERSRSYALPFTLEPADEVHRVPPAIPDSIQHKDSPS